jgi:hypothetical protein
MVLLVSLSLGLVALGAGAWLLAGGRGRRGRGPLVGIRGRVVSPGRPGETVFPATGARPPCFEVEARDGARHAVLGEGARLQGWGAPPLVVVGEQVEIDGVASDQQRSDQLYRESAVRSAVDAITIRHGVALYRRAAGAALIGLALVLVAAPFALRARHPARDSELWTVLQGEHWNGQREGRWVERDPGGNVVESQYRAGKLEGLRSERSPSGRLQRQVPYRAGQIEGTLLEWDEEGRLDERTEYRRGKPHGKHEAWVEGKLVESGVHRDGARDGLWFEETCIEDEFLQAYGHCRQSYRAGQLDGPAEWWFDGGPRVKGHYTAGQPSGAWQLIGADGSIEDQRSY